MTHGRINLNVLTVIVYCACMYIARKVHPFLSFHCPGKFAKLVEVQGSSASAGGAAHGVSVEVKQTASGRLLLFPMFSGR